MPPAMYKSFMELHGGENDTVSEVKVPPTDASVAENVDLDRDGAVSKRKGAVWKNLTNVLSGSVGMMTQFRPSGGTAKLLVAHDDAIEEWDGEDTFVELISGLSANKIILPAPYRNLLYLMNRFDHPMVYYQDAGGAPYIFRAGTPYPGSPGVTKNNDIFGNMETTGVYRYRMRNYSLIDQSFVGEPYPLNDQGTSMGTPNSAPSGGIKLDVPAWVPAGGAVDYRVSGRMIERTTAGGGIFYICAYSSGIAATTYDDTLSDASLITRSIAPTIGYREVPPKLWPFTTYKNRVVGADIDNPGLIVWSEIDEFGLLPEAFPDTYYQWLDIEDDYDIPQAMAKLGEYLIIYCGRSFHLFAIDAGGGAYSRRIGGHRLGFPNPRCVVELPGGHLLWTLKGPYFFDGTNMIFIGERIETRIQRMNKGALDEMFTIHRSQEKRRQVKFVVPNAASSQNDFCAKYHYRRVTLNPEGFPVHHAWTFDDDFTARSGCMALDGLNQEVEYSGNYAGKLFLEDEGSTNDHHGDGDIDSVYETGWLDMDLAHVVKYFEEVWVFLAGIDPDQTADVANVLNVHWETSFGSGPAGTAALPTAVPDAAVFGTAKFGEATFFGGEARIVHTQLGNDGVCAYGRYLRLRFYNPAPNEDWTLVGFIVKFSPDRDRDEPTQ